MKFLFTLGKSLLVPSSTRRKLYLPKTLVSAKQYISGTRLTCGFPSLVLYTSALISFSKLMCPSVKEKGLISGRDLFKVFLFRFLKRLIFNGPNVFPENCR